MSKSKWIKPSAFLAAAALIAVIVVGIVASSARVDRKLYAESSYMAAPNLALQAQAAANGRKTSAVTDGKSETAFTSVTKARTEIVIDLGAEKEFNAIILKERGLNVKAFELSVSSDGKVFSRIYASDKIEYHRFCSVERTKARFLRLLITQSDAPASVREIQIYDESTRESDAFRVTGYVVNQWTSVACDTTLRYAERKQRILADMSRQPWTNLTNIFLYTGIGFDTSGKVFIGGANEMISDEVKSVREQGLELVMECLREKCKPSVLISFVISNSLDHAGMNLAMGDNGGAMAANLIGWANRFGFNGIDIDYEFPQSKKDFEVFDAFLIMLKQKMRSDMNGKENAVLSCAFGTRDIDYSPQAFNSLDYVNVMTYDIMDQDGYHSSFWGGGMQAAVYFESMGVSRKKINMGIPFYGTQIEAVMEQYSYADIEHTDYFQNIYMMPGYTHGIPTPVYFNSASMARDKTAYALLSGYGGVMVWHTTADIAYDHPHSLWRAVDTALAQYGGR